MTKLCGFFGAGQDRLTLTEIVKTMAHAMHHGSQLNERFAWFDSGGIAILSSHDSASDALAWDITASRCLGLAGNLVASQAVLLAASASGKQPVGQAQALLQAYVAEASSLLPHLNGDFAFATYDARTNTLTLANSKYGFCPLYYYTDSRGCWFASEVKALARVIPQAELDWEAAADFFYAGHMLGSRTLLRGVSALDAGEVLTYSQGRVERVSHSDFTRTPPMQAGDVSTRELATRFLDAVARRTSNAASTLLLSGGLDSRLILGALHRLGVRPRLLSLEHADEWNGADGRYATQLARQLGMDCELRRTRPGFYASADCLNVFHILDGMVPTWDLFISQVYAELVPELGAIWEGMALGSGLGAAHQCAGGIAANLPLFLEKRALHRRLLKRILTPEAFGALDQSFAARLHAEIERIPVSENQYGYFVLKHRIRRRIAPNPHQLFASVVEPRTPGTDTAFLDYALAVPSSMRRHHRLYLAMVKQHFPELLSVPIISGGQSLPIDITMAMRLRQYAEGPRALVTSTLRQFNPKRMVKSALRRPESQEEREKMQTMLFVLAQTDFDRPFYNTTQLRSMFAAYRDGAMLYHELFTLVFYIELWHLLFLDRSTSLLDDIAAGAHTRSVQFAS